MISKKMALEVATTLISGEKVRDDYGFTALKEAGDIIENMKIAEEMEKKEVREKPKVVKLAGDDAYWKAIVKEQNKEIKTQTILDLEKCK